MALKKIRVLMDYIKGDQVLKKDSSDTVFTTNTTCGTSYRQKPHYCTSCAFTAWKTQMMLNLFLQKRR